MKPFNHADNSVKLFGGEYKDYIEVHKFFDTFRNAVGDPRHRMFLHNTVGIMICEMVFGDFIENSEKKRIAVRDIAEQHIMEDLGQIPLPTEWLDNINAKEWVKPFAAKLEKAYKKIQEGNNLEPLIDMSEIEDNHDDYEELIALMSDDDSNVDYKKKVFELLNELSLNMKLGVAEVMNNAIEESGSTYSVTDKALYQILVQYRNELILNVNKFYDIEIIGTN
ncbi:MAG: hypothetical protein U9Q66_04175, partial [Patescibacteria group bacterium]|nr:hypothetical protein [Patescibacteria group bacterium]